MFQTKFYTCYNLQAYINFIIKPKKLNAHAYISKYIYKGGKVFCYNHWELGRYILTINITALFFIYLQLNIYFPDEIKFFTLL